MIVRQWHGWTLPENAEAYERLLREEIFPGIFAKNITGLRNIDLLRRPSQVGSEVEFITLLWFDSEEAIEALAGPDPEKSYVPDSARKVLARFDERACHYEVRDRIDPTGD